MSNRLRLDYNTSQNSWEPVTVKNSSGLLLTWNAAAVRHSGNDFQELFAAASDGRIYESESGNTDNGVAVAITAATKRLNLGAVCLLQELYLRFDGISDTVIIAIECSGSEYGVVSRSYSISLAGSGTEKEVKRRLHRILRGRLVKVTMTGSVSNRPSIRELSLRYVPIREGRVSN